MDEYGTGSIKLFCDEGGWGLGGITSAVFFVVDESLAPAQIVVPDNMAGLFQGWTSLEEVHFDVPVSGINDYSRTFAGCTSLKAVYVNGVKVWEHAS